MVKADGSVVTWGIPHYFLTSNEAQEALTNDVFWVVGTDAAFAAVRANGSVVTWDACGAHSTAVKEELASNMYQITGVEQAFAAVKNDGSVVTWGDNRYGGDSCAVQELLRQ